LPGYRAERFPNWCAVIVLISRSFLAGASKPHLFYSRGLWHCGRPFWISANAPSPQLAFGNFLNINAMAASMELGALVPTKALLGMTAVRQ
jgi:hypothetical protein